MIALRSQAPSDWTYFVSRAPELHAAHTCPNSFRFGSLNQGQPAWFSVPTQVHGISPDLLKPDMSSPPRALNVPAHTKLQSNEYIKPSSLLERRLIETSPLSGGEEGFSPQGWV